jgi:uncharacterized protein YybS (DUF2232 family)
VTQGQETGGFIPPREIAAGVAATSLIFAASLAIPIFGFFLSMLIPLPTLFYRAKLGRKGGAMVALGSALVVAIAVGFFSFDLLFFGEMMLVGFLLGEYFERDLPVEMTVGFTAGIALGSAAFLLVLYGNLAGIDVFGSMGTYLSENLALTLDVYRRMGMSEENVAMIADSLDQIAYVLLRILPGMTAAFVLFATWVALLLARPLLRNRDLSSPDFGSLQLWKPPEVLVWGVIAFGVALMLPDKTIKILALNGLIVLMTIYFFGGIAIVSYFFEKKRFPIVVRVFLYSLIALQQLFLLLVIGLGFFDMWLNFRKLEEPPSDTPAG